MSCARLLIAMKLPACIALLTLLPALPAAAIGVDIPALVECRQGIAEHAALSAAAADPLKAVALGLQPLAQQNPFMTEFRLANPTTVFGHPTDHIALAGASIMAVLDLADPRPLAAGLKLETAYDADGKFMAGREVVSRDTTDPKTGEPMIESIILSVSTVRSHPGQTLAGCSYSLDLPAEEEGTPAAAAATEG